MALPPSPIITRWGTWLQAAVYYADYFEIIEHIIDGLDEKEAESIVAAKQAITDAHLFADLVYIKTNFEFLIGAIEAAQVRGQSIDVMLSKAEEIRQRLKALERKEFSVKWESVIGNNVGFSSLTKVSDLI